MADCECLPGCPFFNDRMAQMPVMADVIKKKYCRGDNAHCARHMVKVARGTAGVPIDLFPNQQDRAKALLLSA